MKAPIVFALVAHCRGVEITHNKQRADLTSAKKSLSATCGNRVSFCEWKNCNLN